MANGDILGELELEAALKRADPAELSLVTAKTVHYLAREMKSLRAETVNAFSELPCRKGQDCIPQPGQSYPSVTKPNGKQLLFVSAGASTPPTLAAFAFLGKLLGWW